jgi:hypothetical protein
LMDILTALHILPHPDELDYFKWSYTCFSLSEYLENILKLSLTLLLKKHVAFPPSSHIPWRTMQSIDTSVGRLIQTTKWDFHWLSSWGVCLFICEIMTLNLALGCVQDYWKWVVLYLR